MGVFDKLKFWKKEDEFDFDKLAGEESSNMPDESRPMQDDLGLGQSALSGEPEMSGMPKNEPRTSPFDQPKPEQPQTPRGNVQDYSLPNRELELISSKLDTIKAILRSLDQRTANLEKVAGVEQEKEKNRLW
ncbi:MAG: hypothetical protein ABIG93_02085 [archaeon]|nr:hypothetical protein [Nanoarchaeota archaeon]